MRAARLTHLVIVDVDGTMIRNQSAVRDEFLGAFTDVTGGMVEPETLQFAGMTDRGIVRAMLQSIGREAEFDETFTVFEKRFEERLRAVYNDHPDPRLLQGVKPLLESLDSLPNVVLALGTGNCRSTCEIKLRRFGLWNYFPVGGFGGEHEIRSDALRAAVEEATKVAGWNGGVVWVIGDTVRDVSAARAIGANVLAVATGPDSWEALEEAQPDVLLPDLADTNEVMRKLRLV